MDTLLENSTKGGQIVERPHIWVEFQSGLPSEVGINGCRVEDVIDVAIERLEQYQNGSLPCSENEQAVVALQAAKRALQARLRHRREQAVLNTMSRHEPIRTEDEEHDFSATGA